MAPRASAAVIAALALTLASVPSVRAINNGLNRKPAQGWATWCTNGPCSYDVCTESEVLSVASSMQASGLYDAGWNWIALDDCWAAGYRDANGELTPDPVRFPRGMRYLADTLHGMGYRLSIYTSLGNNTCHPNSPGHNVPGSFGHYEQDATTLAVTFDADRIKADWCGVTDGTTPNIHQVLTDQLAQALNATGKPVLFNFHCGGSGGGHNNYALWCAIDGSSSRVSHDQYDSWQYTNESIEALAGWGGRYAGLQPGGAGVWWPDADLMPIGGPGCAPNSTAHCPAESDVEYRTMLSFWALSHSDLFFSTDPRNLTGIMAEVLLNRELIAVNQDPGAADIAGAGAKRLGYQACPGGGAWPCELWHKTNSTGAHFAILYNGNDPAAAGSGNATFLLSFSDLGLPAGVPVAVRDLWAHEDLGSFNGSYTAVGIQPHEARTLQLVLQQ